YHVLFLLSPNKQHPFLRSHDFSHKLNQKEPELASHIRNRRGRAVTVDSPVVYPLSQRVSIKDGTQQQDRFFCRIPVFKRKPHRDMMLARVGLGGFWLRGG